MISRPKGTKTTLEWLFAQCAPEPNSGCWLWTRALNAWGYGDVQHEGRVWKAHRVSYTLACGEIPAGLELDHLCRVRCCINPMHLEPVTRTINILRGEGPQVLRKRQGSITHCRQGHEFSKENTYLYMGARHCKLCGVGRLKSRRQAQKLERTSA